MRNRPERASLPSNVVRLPSREEAAEARQAKRLKAWNALLVRNRIDHDRAEIVGRTHCVSGDWDYVELGRITRTILDAGFVVTLIDGNYDGAGWTLEAERPY